MKKLNTIYKRLKAKWIKFEKFMEKFGKAAGYAIHR